MITTLFKNDLLSYVIIILVAGFLWTLSYVQVTQELLIPLKFANQEFFFSRKTALMISFGITLISGWYLNYLVKKHLYSYEPSNLFLFFYVIIISMGLSSIHFLSHSIVALLLVTLVNYLLYFGEKGSNEKQVFNSALIIGVLIFHNVFFIILIALLIHNLSSMKRIKLKEVLLIVFGCMLPSLYLIIFTSLTDNLDVISSVIELTWITPLMDWKYSILIPFLYASYMGYRIVVTKRSGIDITIIRLTKNLFVSLVILGVIAMLSIFLFELCYVFFVLAIPLSIFLSDFFSNSSSKWREVGFVFIVAITFLLRL